jgi:DNA-binding NarL/FixJ family response regulator
VDSSREEHLWQTLDEVDRNIALVARTGATEDEIASAMHLSEVEVGRRMQRIFRKLGVDGRLQLVLHIIYHGFESRPPEAS